MNDIEQKALALMNAIRAERDTTPLTVISRKEMSTHEAIYRAIEQHEAFRQKVSDAIIDYFGEHLVPEDGDDALASLVIPAPKPDLLVRIINEVIYAQPHGDINEVRMADDLRAALDACGLEIREKNDD